MHFASVIGKLPGRRFPFSIAAAVYLKYIGKELCFITIIKRVIKQKPL
jgi:hypothetical protein